MAFDPGTGQLVLFGGTNNEADPVNDTWTWDGSTWTQQSPATSPSARHLASAGAYDPDAGQLVLFGGYGRRLSSTTPGPGRAVPNRRLGRLNCRWRCYSICAKRTRWQLGHPAFGHFSPVTPSTAGSPHRAQAPKSVLPDRPTRSLWAAAVYAQWTANATDEYSYATADGTGSAPASGSGLDGSTITLAANPFTYLGYTFAGWSDGTAT